MQIPTRGSSPSPRNSEFPRAVAVHHSGMADFYAQEGSIAQELKNPTRGNGPPLRNRRISRVVAVQHSGIANFHAWERSIAQESRISTRGSDLPLRNCVFSCARKFHCLE